LLLPVLQVDLLVRDVDVAHQDELALGLQGGQVRVHLGQEAELGGLALLAARTAGEVAADDAELAPGGVEALLDPAALGVELGRAEADAQIAGLLVRVEADARIALLLRVVEVAVQSRPRFRPIPRSPCRRRNGCRSG
jgi:hypothetical protein